MFDEDRMQRIIDILCLKNNLSKERFMQLCRDKEYRDLMILILKKHGCESGVENILDFKSKRSVKYNMNKAEERFFVNSDFRKKYFELEEEIENLRKSKK